MTLKDAAEKLGLSVPGVRYHIRAGNLKATKAGRDYLIEEKELARFAKLPRVPGWHGQKRNRKKH